jgi:siroheme synthase-like protein
MKTYPINLVLADRLVLLIGAKGEIVHKVDGLLEVGARVRVIAPSAAAEVAHLAAEGRIEWLPRRYQPGDLAGASLVFAAVRDATVHDAIWAEGTGNGQLVNVMDVIPQCNFYGVSFLRRGLLTIAIGTGGAAPALAVTLRKRFEQEFGPEYAAFLDFAKALRPEVSRRIPSFRRRQQFWYALVESEALDLLRHDLDADVCAVAVRLLDQYANSSNNTKEKPSTDFTDLHRLIEGQPQDETVSASV